MALQASNLPLQTTKQFARFIHILYVGSVGKMNIPKGKWAYQTCSLKNMSAQLINWRPSLACFGLFWAAAPKGKSCRTQGDFRLSVRQFVHQSIHLLVPPPDQASQASNQASQALNQTSQASNQAFQASNWASQVSNQASQSLQASK